LPAFLYFILAVVLREEVRRALRMLGFSVLSNGIRWPVVVSRYLSMMFKV